MSTLTVSGTVLHNNPRALTSFTGTILFLIFYWYIFSHACAD